MHVDANILPGVLHGSGEEPKLHSASRCVRIVRNRQRRITSLEPHFHIPLCDPQGGTLHDLRLPCLPCVRFLAGMIPMHNISDTAATSSQVPVSFFRTPSVFCILTRRCHHCSRCNNSRNTLLLDSLCLGLLIRRRFRRFLQVSTGFFTFQRKRFERGFRQRNRLHLTPTLTAGIHSVSELGKPLLPYSNANTTMPQAETQRVSKQLTRLSHS